MRTRNYFFQDPVFFLVTLAFLLSPLSFLHPNAYAISIEDENMRGKDVALFGQYTDAVLDNGFARQYFNDLGQYLTTPVETRHFKFHFYIIKSNEVNAFATFAGNIFFYSGLIKMVDSVDELASVLCHEISHVSARHISKGMERQKKVMIAQLAGMLAGAFIGGEAAAPLIMGSAAAGEQARINYTRENERQADQMAFKYMDASGFDTKEMITFFNKLEQVTKMNPYLDQAPPYVLDHPRESERMANIETMMTDYTPGESGIKVARFREQFPFFLAVIRAISLEQHDAEKIFFRELEKNPDSVSSHYGLGIVYTLWQEYGKAIEHLEKAGKAKPDFAPILTSLGKAYQRNGQDNKALFVLEKAMKLNEEDNSIPFLIGVSYENLEQYDKAIRILTRLTYLEPVENGVYYHLGVSYGKQDKLVLAHYNFGLCYKRWRSIKKARFHFQKAFDLAKDDPELREKIKKEQEELRRDYPRQREREGTEMK